MFYFKVTLRISWWLYIIEAKKDDKFYFKCFGLNIFSNAAIIFPDSIIAWKSVLLFLNLHRLHKIHNGIQNQCFSHPSSMRFTLKLDIVIHKHKKQNAVSEPIVGHKTNENHWWLRVADYSSCFTISIY